MGKVAIDILEEISLFSDLTPALALNQKDLHRFLDKWPHVGIKIYKRFARIMSGRMKTLIVQLTEGEKPL